MSTQEEKDKRAAYMRAYNSLPINKEKKSIRDKEYVENNKAKVATLKRNYQKSNRQYLLDYHKQWRSKPENQEKIYGYTKKRIESGAIRRTRLKKYGITLEQYNEILERQEYKCAICLQPSNTMKKSMPVDHNHITGKIRGLLCSTCNTAIGLLKENPDLFIRAVSYLHRYTIQD